MTKYEYATFIIVGFVLVIAVEDIKWFLLFLLICLLIISHQIIRLINFNWKAIRVFRVSSDIQLQAIAAKLKVSRAEMKDVFTEMKKKISEKELESLMKDVRDITGAIVIDDDFVF